MHDDDVDSHTPSPSSPPSSPSTRATSLQKFEASPDYCISVLNNLGMYTYMRTPQQWNPSSFRTKCTRASFPPQGGSSVLLLAFAVTAISRYIPPSSCVYDNGRQSMPTEPRPFPIARLNGADAASFPSCRDYPEKDVFITFAVAAALCGYVASLHGVCMYTLVSNYMQESKKEAFMRRMYRTFLAGAVAFFVGVFFLFMTLAFNGYGIQASRLYIIALNSTNTKWTWDRKPADVPLYICICLSAILL